MQAGNLHGVFLLGEESRLTDNRCQRMTLQKEYHVGMLRVSARLSEGLREAKHPVTPGRKREPRCRLLCASRARSGRAGAVSVEAGSPDRSLSRGRVGR